MKATALRVAAALRRHPTLADAGLALLFALAAVVSVSTTFELLRVADPKYHQPAEAPIFAALVAVMLPLALRRRFPLAAAAAVVAAFTLGRILVSPGVPFLNAWEQYLSVWACWLAVYTAVAFGARVRRTALVVAVLMAVLLAEVVREVFFYEGGGIYRDLPLNQGFLLVYNVVFLSWPIVLGAVVRSLRNRSHELAAQAAELQREREENARRAVLEERVRIARELHDVVAHHVSVMGVQAGAARRVMASRPEKAEEVLGSIEASSRQAVVELHRLLGFLRRDDQPDGLAPQPDLTQLPELVSQAGQGGLHVELEVNGEPRPLAPTLEVSAYRVIQEALTNALKHSGGTHARVRIDYGDTALAIDVEDDGRGAAPRRARTGGHGLLGMRERVGLHGGHLRAGDAPGGGFAVHATFPLDGAVT